MLSKTSQWHTTMPVRGSIHAINKAVDTHKSNNVAVAINTQGALLHKYLAVGIHVLNPT
jgi:hypothetical protein